MILNQSFERYRKYAPRPGRLDYNREHPTLKHLRFWYPLNFPTNGKLVNTPTDTSLFVYDLVTKDLFGVADSAVSNNTTAYLEDPIWGYSIVPGNTFNEFINFTGTKSQIWNPSINRFCVMLWWKAPSTTGSGGGSTREYLYSIADGSGQTDGVFIYYQSDTGIVHADFDVGASNGCYLSTSTSYLDGQWHHIAFYRDEDRNGKLYIDGKLVAQKTSNSGSFAGINTDTEALFTLASDYQNTWWHGGDNVIDVRIYEYEQNGLFPAPSMLPRIMNDPWEAFKPSSTTYFLPLAAPTEYTRKRMNLQSKLSFNGVKVSI